MIKSAEEFVRLRESDKQEEYFRAAHEEADVEVWHQVIAQFPDMKSWVAHNKKIPESIIRILAKDNNADVRFFIAQKRKTPPDVLEALSTDLSESVRIAVATNKKTPRYILESMLKDEWDEIVSTVKRKLGIDQQP